MSRPLLAGSGPVTFSTCQDLARSPEWIADVNGYYRDLGVDPRASRAQIARAYFERGRDDARLTFVVTQLLDPAVRQAYDRTALGHVFLDAEVLAHLRHRLAARVSQGGGSLATEAEGLSVTQAFLGVIDKRPYSHQDAHSEAVWPWSYYLWDTDQVDIHLLRHWQDVVVVALAGIGMRGRVAIGLMGGSHCEVEVVQVEDHPVIFVHEQYLSSTDALAQRVVSQIQFDDPITPEEDRRMSKAPAFRRGTDEAKEASKGVSFARTHYFSLDGNPSSPNNRAIIRFLTDYTDLIVVNQHNNIPTKAQPKDYDGQNWPSRMSAVCRNDEAFAGMYDDCFICDHIVDGKKIKRPGARSWALAVLREEVLEDGVVVGLRDQIREVAEVDADGKATGEVRLEKAIVVVNMGYKNFFAAVEGFGKHYKTLLDRDYQITRSGEDTDTTYAVVPLDRIPVDDDGNFYDLRKPEFMDRYKPAQTLEEIVIERSSDDFYARFFDTRVEAPAREGATSGKATKTKAKGKKADAPARQEQEASSERLAALRDRVVDYGRAVPAQDGEADESDDEVEEKPALKAKAKKKNAIRNFDN